MFLVAGAYCKSGKEEQSYWIDVTITSTKQVLSGTAATLTRRAFCNAPPHHAAGTFCVGTRRAVSFASALAQQSVSSRNVFMCNTPCWHRRRYKLNTKHRLNFDFKVRPV